VYSIDKPTSGPAILTQPNHHQEATYTRIHLKKLLKGSLQHPTVGSNALVLKDCGFKFPLHKCLIV
jgi:hypothetical protein